MNIAILSGKGGTGKTFIAVNLAKSFKKSCYIDCDIEEPNGALFFKPKNICSKDVFIKLPYLISDLCKSCNKCASFCNFNAIALVNKKPIFFHNVCHSCGGCRLVCENNAIYEKDKVIGKVETGYSDDVCVKTGILNVGEQSGIPIIKKLINSNCDINIIDCPPGSSCTVIESIKDVDYCVIVSEPTIFGVDNFKMVYELVNLLNKPFGVIINKIIDCDNPMEQLCEELNIKVLERIYFDKLLARYLINGQIAYDNDLKFKNFFDNLKKKIMKEII